MLNVNNSEWFENMPVLSTLPAAPTPTPAAANARKLEPHSPVPRGAVVVSKVDCVLQYEVDGPTDGLFLVHALKGLDQLVVDERLEIEPALSARCYADPTMAHRFMRLNLGVGRLTLRYRATVHRAVEAYDPAARFVPIVELPDAVMHNLMPTRYCESDVMCQTAFKLFGHVTPGAPQVMAIVEWIHKNIEYRVGSTNSSSTAKDVYIQRAGVCRDFAHLGITFCRALNIPARLVAGYAPFDEPPPDFHAVFEAYIGDRWVIFDPTRLSPPERLVRIASGRDAKDIAFATLFGPARMTSMAPEIRTLSLHEGAQAPAVSPVPGLVDHQAWAL
jgi:hypothetical protein